MAASSILGILLAMACVLLPLCEAQASCSERCGESYYRGHICHCDYNCLIHNECCKDYESMCTTSDSCKGRCGESFRRGRPCSCDSDCVQYNQCCPDYENHCGRDSLKSKPIKEPSDVTQSPVSTKNEDINQDLSESLLIPLSTPAEPIQQTLEIQRDEGIDQTLHQVPAPTIETADPVSTLSPESMSGQEPLLINTTEDMPTPGDAETTPDPTLPSLETPTSQGEPDAFAEEIHTPVPEEQLLPSNPTGTPTVDESNDISVATPAIPASEPPIEITDNTATATSSTSGGQTDSNSSLSSSVMPVTAPNGFLTPQPTAESMQDLAETMNPNTSSTREDEEISPVGSETTTQIAEAPEPQTTATTSEADTPAPTGSGEGTPSVSQSLDASAAPGLTESAPSVSQDTDKPAATADSSPSVSQDTDIPSSTGFADRLLPTNMPELVSADSTTPASLDETSAAAGTPSLSMEADEPKVEGDASTSSPPQVSLSVTPQAETEAQSGPASPGATTGADTPSAGNDITSAAQPGGSTSGQATELPPTPAGEAQDSDTQATLSGNTPSAPLKPSLPSAWPSKKPRPSTLTDIAEALATNSPSDHLADDNNDTNLCSGRPINGLTTLRNGTVVVFRGHYFWVLDANRVPGPARGITDVWGIPSPIDTVFTRCNCQGKTYFFKGNNYWRFENDVMDPNYPKPISGGFSGLAGKITAALSVPATDRRRQESVYFFKRGGLVQKYTYLHGTNPTCSNRVKHIVYAVRTRTARQAAPSQMSLSKEINIRLTWRGFPSVVTSAVSIPSPRKPDGYDYYIFSKTKYYNIKMDDEQPALVTPLSQTSQQNSAKNWFKCP
ncbi:proteoglycan 4b [Megalops cyprinoides]|uniref:proteoglycan 4b n=1 Tax=Megalops cyprinoides TaxID=118141 RepID=UPI001863F300|nr:proteoglycan 4b [Megalops cyprinoides]